jgi:hypothetical protein
VTVVPLAVTVPTVIESAANAERGMRIARAASRR